MHFGFWVDAILSSVKSELCSPLQATAEKVQSLKSSRLTLVSKISRAGANGTERYFKGGFDLRLCNRFAELIVA